MYFLRLSGRFGGFEREKVLLSVKASPVRMAAAAEQQKLIVCGGYRRKEGHY